MHSALSPGSPAPADATRFGRAWLALAVALAIHVADEAANDFLSVYNPAVHVMRDRLPWLPLPTFTFPVWITGLAVLVTVLLALAPAAFRGTRGLVLAAMPFAALMIGNGLLHLGSSLYAHRLMPGVLSSPVLIAAAALALVCARRLGRRKHEGT